MILNLSSISGNFELPSFMMQMLVAASAQIISSWVKGTRGTLFEEQSTFSAYLGLQWRVFPQDSYLRQHKHSLKTMEASLGSVSN